MAKLRHGFHVSRFEYRPGYRPKWIGERRLVRKLQQQSGTQLVARTQSLPAEAVT